MFDFRSTMSLASSMRPLRNSIRSSHINSLTVPLRPAPGNTPTSSCRASPFSHTTVRHATHGAQGRANGPKNGPGKRLGAKKTGDEFVIPGNIIFRQRGTTWYPGDNAGMGRDHTIYALKEGYVRYYRDPNRHPDKKYIGIVLDKSHTLPAPKTEPRRRRLGMVAVERKDLVAADEAWELAEASKTGGIGVVPNPTDPSGRSLSIVQAASRRRKPAPYQLREIKRLVGNGRVPTSELKMRPDYSYRETNYQIGLSAKRAGVTAPVYKHSDRFLAWRKRTLKAKVKADKRSMVRKKGGARKGKVTKRA